MKVTVDIVDDSHSPLSINNLSEEDKLSEVINMIT